MAIDVFLSVGRSSSDKQEEFVNSFERCLIDHDLRPLTLGRNEWSSSQPLIAVRERMEECSGIAVLALERLHIEDGSDLANVSNARVQDESLPTVWNQIEAAMAYILGLPLLVIGEDGLRVEGLLESRYDWAVQWLPLDPQALQSRQSLGIIEDWKHHVVKVHERRQQIAAAPSESDPASRTIAELVGDLKPGQLRALLAGGFGIFSAVAGAAYTLGSKVG